jgi:hypothetical protein
MLWLFLWSVFLCSSIGWGLEGLDGLNGGGWGVFITSNLFLAVGWLCCRWAHQTVRWCTGHGTVHCPVCATSADCWGLELLTVEVFCPLAAPDSPVAHRTVWCVLTLQTNFWLLHYSLFCSQRSRPLGEVDHCSVGSPNSPVNFGGMTLRKPKSGQFARCCSLGTEQCPVRH